MRIRPYITAVLFAVSALTTMSAAEPDSIAPKRHGLINRVLDYFKESNTDKSDKGFDFSIIGGPHYASDTKLGLGLVAAGLYRTNRFDTITPRSNVSLFGDISTSGFYMIGIRGNHFFPMDRYRLDYSVYFYSFPSYFWGIGYQNQHIDSNKSKYKRLQAKAEVNFLARIAENLYAGPGIEYCFIQSKNPDNPALWLGQQLKTTSLGYGLTLSYDSRDLTTNASRGIYLAAQQRFYPGATFNDYAFSSTEITASAYRKVWSGGIFATRIHGMFTYGNTPWGMMAELGDDAMRGYYKGRYRDKNDIDFVAELRQHVWRRNGIVVWAGAGTVFPRFEELRWKRILPEAGIGYRWEFKDRVNVRLDFGIGRNSTGFLFGINEAF